MTASSSSCSEVAAEALAAGKGPDDRRGGEVMLQLRAALEEEKLALLAQTEQLHLMVRAGLTPVHGCA